MVSWASASRRRSGKAWVQKLWSSAIPDRHFRYYDGALYTNALLYVSGAFKLWY